MASFIPRALAGDEFPRSFGRGSAGSHGATGTAGFLVGSGRMGSE